MFGNIFTVAELRSDDSLVGAPFHGLEPTVIRKAIQVLETEGKVRKDHERSRI